MRKIIFTFTTIFLISFMGVAFGSDSFPKPDYKEGDCTQKPWPVSKSYSDMLKDGQYGAQDLYREKKDKKHAWKIIQRRGEMIHPVGCWTFQEAATTIKLNELFSAGSAKFVEVGNPHISGKYKVVGFWIYK